MKLNSNLYLALVIQHDTIFVYLSVCYLLHLLIIFNLMCLFFAINTRTNVQKILSTRKLLFLKCNFNNKLKSIIYNAITIFCQLSFTFDTFICLPAVFSRPILRLLQMQWRTISSRTKDIQCNFAFIYENLKNSCTLRNSQRACYNSTTTRCSVSILKKAYTTLLLQAK